MNRGSSMKHLLFLRSKQVPRTTLGSMACLRGTRGVMFSWPEKNGSQILKSYYLLFFSYLLDYFEIIMGRGTFTCTKVPSTTAFCPNANKERENLNKWCTKKRQTALITCVLTDMMGQPQMVVLRSVSRREHTCIPSIIHDEHHQLLHTFLHEDALVDELERVLLKGNLDGHVLLQRAEPRLLVPQQRLHAVTQEPCRGTCEWLLLLVLPHCTYWRPTVTTNHDGIQNLPIV